MALCFDQARAALAIRREVFLGAAQDYDGRATGSAAP
jgi:hypothetical protein